MKNRFNNSMRIIDRRNFIGQSGLSLLAGILGTQVCFRSNFPENLFPIIFTDPTGPFEIIKKHPELKILSDRPWNVETPAYLLDDKITPADKLFIRNNGKVPENINIDSWTLTVEGESALKRTIYKLADLKNRFRTYEYQITIECGGNGRNEFYPPASGNQWTVGGVGCPVWKGIRLSDVLDDVGFDQSAVFVAYYGADTHLSGDETLSPISRGVSIQKALEAESLIAFGMNGEDLPLMNGYPLRLVFGGWPASTCGKWLTRILIRDRVHDGPKMGGQSYRVPCDPVAPGTDVPDEDMCIIESMPVKSIITYPRTGAVVDAGREFELRGHAWAGDFAVKEMAISTDFGASWQPCTLEDPVNRYAWQHWNTRVKFDHKGYYEIWAKAADSNGKSQPMVVPGWNPKGYLNNAAHRIAVKVV